MRHAPSSPVAALRRWARILWRSIREWSGDAAYDRYLVCVRKSRAHEPPLTPEQFYVDQLDRRYSRPNRCC
jgi:uncharacterized short protein YbdD (DUF466 family)